MWLADTDLSVFTKDTFMNLCNFAEKHNAKDVVFLLDREHKQKNEYRRMFRVIDAKRLGTDNVTSLLKQDSTSSSSDEEEGNELDLEVRAKNVIASIAFYKFAL